MQLSFLCSPPSQISCIDYSFCSCPLLLSTLLPIPILPSLPWDSKAQLLSDELHLPDPRSVPSHTSDKYHTHSALSVERLDLTLDAFCSLGYQGSVVAWQHGCQQLLTKADVAHSCPIPKISTTILLTKLFMCHITHSSIAYSPLSCILHSILFAYPYAKHALIISSLTAPHFAVIQYILRCCILSFLCLKIVFI